MAIWSKKSKSSNQTSKYDGGMVGGLSVDAQSGDRRQPRSVDAGSVDMTLGDYMTGMPNIRLTSLFKGVMRQIPWMILFFLLGCAAIYYLTKDMKRTYHAQGSLLVQIGPEYIYTPVGTPTNNSGGISQTPDTIALNEVGIMKNEAIVTQVTGDMTSATDRLTAQQAEDLFAEDAYKKIRAAVSDREKKDAIGELYQSVSDAYYVSPRPKSSLIDVAFKHENPEIAVTTLKLFLDAYLDKRKDVFESEDKISERLRETVSQLETNERAIARFLERNDISDFTSEQTGVRKRSEDLKAELNTLRGQISETERSLATVEDQLRGTEPSINLYVDDRASQRVAQAELELKQLLAKYLPTSNPVRQKRTELEELKALQSANNGRAAGGRRVGPNPVHQELLTRRNTLKSTADSFREKEFTLQGQLNSAVAKVRNLTKVMPEHQKLLRERTTLLAALDTYNARAQEALIDNNQTESGNENITVISWPETASKGQNVGKLIWAGGSLAWGLTLLMIALLRVFLDPKNFQAPSTSRKGPRRSRSTDGNPPHGDSDIPEPIAPYNPRRSVPVTAAIGGGAVEATRAYNANAAKAEAGAVNTGPEEYQGVNYQEAEHQAQNPYGNPQDYYPPAHNAVPTPAVAPVAAHAPIVGQVQSQFSGPTSAPLEQSYTSEAPANPYLQNNPYLNAQTQAALQGGAVNVETNDLPVLGSFSAAKG